MKLDEELADCVQAKAEGGPWPPMTLEHQEELARIAARYVRWMHPAVVAQVAEANQEAAWQAECTAGLASAGMSPGLYLWQGSTCLYPGIRRPKNSLTEGTPEKSNGRCAPGALRLDSGTNRKAKQVWTTLVTGFESQRDTQHLVHLFPHQGLEVAKVLPATPAPVDAEAALFLADAKKIGLPGLFTSVANMCFMPAELTKPTDAKSLLRQVLWQKAIELYTADFLPPILRPLAAELGSQPVVSGLCWEAPWVGEAKTDAQWQKIDQRRQAEFRRELSKWRDAQPGCRSPKATV